MNKPIQVRNKLGSISIIFFTIFLPWTGFLKYFNNDIEKITSDLRFYQINTCNISLLQFLVNNINVAYQDHYKIVFNSYSSIACFGTITGVDQINDVFYISIGTNTLINILILSIFTFTCFTFLKKNKELGKVEITKILITSIFSSIFFTFGIFSQQKFYARTLYFYDVTLPKEYINFLLIFFSVNLMFVYMIITRGKQFLNYSPFVFIFIGIINGMNFSILILLLINSGFLYLINNFYKLRNFTFYYFILLVIWVISTEITQYNNLFRLDPDKTIGLVSTEMNIYSTIYFSLASFIIVLGILNLVKQSKIDFNLKLFENNLLNTSCIVMILGILSAHFPILNFLIFYFSGQHKSGTTEINLVKYNQWGEYVAWRGFAPSAEMAGEMYSITLLVFLISKLKTKNYVLNFSEFIKVLIVLFGIFLSNNRAALIALFLILSYIIVQENTHMFKKYKINYFYFSFSIVFIIILINIFSDQYYKQKILFEAVNFSYINQESTSLSFFTNDGLIRKYFISTLSVVSVFINRSVLWGLFFSRYNPTPIELLFGSGPFNLAQLYGEVNIKPTSSFLLPHSSFLDLLIFVGVINLILISILLIYLILKNDRKNNTLYYLLIFVTLNIIKSDSILYIPSFVFYISIIIFNLENTKIFKLNKNA